MDASGIAGVVDCECRGFGACIAVADLMQCCAPAEAGDGRRCGMSYLLCSYAAFGCRVVLAEPYKLPLLAVLAEQTTKLGPFIATNDPASGWDCGRLISYVGGIGPHSAMGGGGLAASLSDRTQSSVSCSP